MRVRGHLPLSRKPRAGGVAPCCPCHLQQDGAGRGTCLRGLPSTPHSLGIAATPVFWPLPRRLSSFTDLGKLVITLLPKVPLRQSTSPLQLAIFRYQLGAHRLRSGSAREMTTLRASSGWQCAWVQAGCSLHESSAGCRSRRCVGLVPIRELGSQQVGLRSELGSESIQGIGLVPARMRGSPQRDDCVTVLAATRAASSMSVGMRAQQHGTWVQGANCRQVVYIGIQYQDGIAHPVTSAGVYNLSLLSQTPHRAPTTACLRNPEDPYFGAHRPNKPLPSSTGCNPRDDRVVTDPRFFPSRACRPHLSTLWLLRRPAGPVPHMPPDICRLGCQ